MQKSELHVFFSHFSNGNLVQEIDFGGVVQTTNFPHPWKNKFSTFSARFFPRPKTACHFPARFLRAADFHRIFAELRGISTRSVSPHDSALQCHITCPISPIFHECTHFFLHSHTFFVATDRTNRSVPSSGLRIWSVLRFIAACLLPNTTIRNTKDDTANCSMYYEQEKSEWCVHMKITPMPNVLCIRYYENKNRRAACSHVEKAGSLNCNQFQMWYVFNIMRIKNRRAFLYAFFGIARFFCGFSRCEKSCIFYPWKKLFFTAVGVPTPVSGQNKSVNPAPHKILKLI